MTNRLMTVVIPTYNGEKTLGRTLSSIVEQIQEFSPEEQDLVGVLVGDDGSTDRTLDIVDEYSRSFPFIHYYQNRDNQGMDRNFTKVAREARSKYIWYCGQDDLFKEGVIKQVLKVLNSNSDIGVMYINYTQVDHEFQETITESMLDRISKVPGQLTGSDLLFFGTAEDYYQAFEKAPSFLPATIMRQEYWEDTETERFWGTHYVQLAVLLLNMNRHRMCVYTKPGVVGRIPRDGWQEKGTRYFEVLTGKIRMLTLVFRTDGSPLPEKVYSKHRKIYLINFLFFVYHSKKLGFEVKQRHLDDLKEIFSNTLLYYLYIVPLLKLPESILSVGNLLLLPLKRISLSILEHLFGFRY